MTINAEMVKQGLDPALAFGPSYFMRDGVETPAALDRLWRRELRPMLVEHHYGKHTQVDAWYPFPTWVRGLVNDLVTPRWMKPVPTRSDLERLSEGQTLYPVDLTTAEAAVALNTSQLVKAVPDELGWKVTAEYWVGTVARGDLRGARRPEDRGRSGAASARHGRRSSGPGGRPAGGSMADDADLSAVLARMFVLEAEHALAASPLRGYHRGPDAAGAAGAAAAAGPVPAAVRAVSPLEVTVDEWTVDTAENRLIRSAALALLALPGLTAAWRRTCVGWIGCWSRQSGWCRVRRCRRGSRRG